MAAVGDSDYDVIVIGSGLGGLAAGGVLAHRGLRTAIFEQAPRIGGCCGPGVDRRGGPRLQAP